LTGGDDVAGLLPAPHTRLNSTSPIIFFAFSSSGDQAASLHHAHTC
jgi:hypothetical protein